MIIYSNISQISVLFPSSIHLSVDSLPVMFPAPWILLLAAIEMVLPTLHFLPSVLAIKYGKDTESTWLNPVFPSYFSQTHFSDSASQ